MSKFFRTLVTVEILSENAPFDGNLEDLHHETFEGPSSGAIHSVVVEEVEPPRMAALLLDQGSDPEFFGLSEDGSLVTGDEMEE